MPLGGLAFWALEPSIAHCLNLQRERPTTISLQATGHPAIGRSPLGARASGFFCALWVLAMFPVSWILSWILVCTVSGCATASAHRHADVYSNLVLTGSRPSLRYGVLFRCFTLAEHTSAQCACLDRRPGTRIASVLYATPEVLSPRTRVWRLASIGPWRNRSIARARRPCFASGRADGGPYRYPAPL